MMRLRECLLVVAIVACRSVPTLVAPPQNAAPSNEAVRVHMRDGTVYAATRWSATNGQLHIEGAQYNLDRVLMRRGSFTLPRGDVALLETSSRSLAHAPHFAVLTMLTAGSVIGAAACVAANPKACFGSCPTFYVDTPRGPALQAEGFSAAIARSLEERDLDDMPLARPDANGMLTVTMRNEAYETHVLRRVSVLSVTPPAGALVYRNFDDETFYAIAHEAPPIESVPELPALARRDGVEHTPGSDGVDLAARTTIDLRFDAPHTRNVALTLTARNSLVSTWLLYHLIGRLGGHYGDFIAALERRDPRTLLRTFRFGRMLGGIDVSVARSDERWQTVGTLPYIGPNARATRAVAFEVEDPTAPVRVRLGFARAHWRLDAVQLGSLSARDLASTEHRAVVIRSNRLDPARVEAALAGEGERIATLGGDDVTLRFEVPTTQGTAFFLRAEGYYYEWMRPEWLREEDVRDAHATLDDPAEAMRRLAAPYHQQEPELDAIFEASRYGEPGGGTQP